jgi:nitrite reductase (NADH) small subunit
MPLVKVGSLAELGPGSVVEVWVGDQRFALCNAGGTVHALDGACLHAGGPLGHGAMNGHQVVCPWHLWEFDCRTGAYDRNPDCRVATFPVTIDGDDILIEVPCA